MRRVLVAAALLSACARDGAPPVDLRIEPGPTSTRIRLMPAAGWRINAFLPPAFELDDGSVIRLGAERVGADSAYYLEPPAATLPGSHRALRGTLRASVCAVGEQVCRPYVAQF